MKELRKVIIKTLIAVWALAGGSFCVVLSGFQTEIPVAKYLFTVLENRDGGGMLPFFALFGVGAWFYLVKSEKSNMWIRLLSVFFALTTLLGLSYQNTGSWDAIFLYGTQFLMAVFVGVGLYFLYENGILLLKKIYLFFRASGKSIMLQGKYGKRLEVLCDKHPIFTPFCGFVVCGLPWLIAFFPGTLQWDAHAQLWMAMGVIEQTSYHPVFISNYMAACIGLGNKLFHSDSIGLFMYTFPQFILQSLVFAYALSVVRKLKASCVVQMVGFLFLGVFPYFPIWGFTMVKDTPYYISFVLFVAVVVEVLSQRNIKPSIKQVVLFALACSGMVLSRNDGRYVVLASVIMLFLVYHKLWKILLAGFIVCMSLLVLEEQIFMPMQGIGKGPAGEMLSVPLQQTARYLAEYPEDVTKEEAMILQQGFDISIDEIANKYNPEISDPVKIHFLKQPDEAYLQAYMKVWLAQLSKHPDVYVQAFLHKNYGYFYPGCPDHGDYLIVSYLGNSDHWQDEALDLSFGIHNEMPRAFLRELVYVIKCMPGLSLLYGCGLYTYLMLGMMTWLLGIKKRRELVVFVPMCCVLFICLLSPVNGYVRYAMPIMACMPMLYAWCSFCDRERIDLHE